MFWTIRFFSRCTYHVFLSHCAEDREALAFPLYEELRRQGVRVWLDRHDDPYGRGSRAALRDAILTCRHAVFLATDTILATSRGWCVQELAWAELLQDNLLEAGGPTLVNVTLPLYLVPPSDPRLVRSVWNSSRDRGPFHTSGTPPVEWAAEQVMAFLKREEELVYEYKRFARADKAFRDQLRLRTGLPDRVTKFDPSRIPTQSPMLGDPSSG